MRVIIEEIINSAQKEAQKYFPLCEFIDWNSIRKQLLKNPSLYNRGDKESPLNILESLLRPTYYKNPVYDPKVNLMVLNDGLANIMHMLNDKDKASFSSKINNLSNTAFWDTSPEIWLASRLQSSGQKIMLDFPMGKANKKFTPSTADVAIIDNENNPTWLIDAFSPVLDKEKDFELIFDDESEAYFFDLSPEKATSWLLDKTIKKYNDKFSAYVESFPNTRFALFLSVTKADMISPHFSNVKIPVRVNNSQLQNCKNLFYAVAGRFQNDNGRLSFIRLIEYERII